jgi:hypothetical protein
MPRKRDETNEQWMDRLRAARGLPPQREELMGRVAAAQCYISTVRDQKRAEVLELAAFMSIFHPEHELASAPALRLKQVLGQCR